MSRTVHHRLRLRTDKAQDVVDITARVAAVVGRSGVRDGLCNVYVRHATAAVIINENADPGFRQDVVTALDRLVPAGIWEHDKIDDNGAAHLKASILGPTTTVPVEHGRLLLGTWQGIALVECDGPRDREIVVSIIGE